MRQIIWLAAVLVSACAGESGTENTVQVGKLAAGEVDRVPFLVAHPAFACDERLASCTGSVPSDLALKWGTGFCMDTRAELASVLSTASVELFVDRRQVAKKRIFERDEYYDRPHNGYCHTWLIKLSQWRANAQTELHSSIAYGGGRIDEEKTIVTVK